MTQKFVACDEICGLEFDWYAVDLSNQYALFSTAGSGMIPECIVPHIEDYGCVSMPSASQGKNPWTPIGNAGLFVFDMCNSDVYKKQVNATGVLKEHRLKDLENLPNLLQFNGHFEQITKIANLSDFSLKHVAIKGNNLKNKVKS